MITQETPVQIFFIVCLIGILCSVVGACVIRNAAEAATKPECKIINVSDVGSYNTVLMVCPERSYRCFRYTASSYSSSISCVPAGR